MTSAEASAPDAVIPAEAGIHLDAPSRRHSRASGNPATFARYPEYKDSGVELLGEIPTAWTAVAISRVLAEPVTDGPHLTPEFIDDGVPFLSVDSIQDGRLVFEGCRYISAADHDAFSKKCHPQRDDILLGKAASVGKVARVSCDFEFSIWSPLALIRTDASLCRPAFLEYALKSPAAQAQIQTKANSNTQYNIGMKDIPTLRVALPPPAEQAAIATFLDRETAKIDALIVEQEKLIALLKEKRQALISHAVTKGLDPNAAMKDSGIEWLGQVPVHWGARCLKTLSKFTTSGPRGWSDRIAEEGSLFIQSGDLNDALGVDFDKAKRVEVGDEAEALRTCLRNGDVVVCITGAKTGNVALCSEVPEDAYVNQHLCLVRPNAEVLPLFLGMSLKSRLGQIQFELSQYGLKQGLSLENVREVFVTVPPIEEQYTIVVWLGKEMCKFDALQVDASRAIGLLKERRAALISAAITGKIDVRGLVSQNAQAQT